MDTNFTRNILALLSKSIRSMIKKDMVIGAMNVIDITINQLDRIKRCSRHEKNVYLSKLLGAKFDLFCKREDRALQKLWDVIIQTRRGELMLDGRIDEAFACKACKAHIGVFNALPHEVLNKIMTFVHEDVSKTFIN